MCNISVCVWLYAINDFFSLFSSQRTVIGRSVGLHLPASQGGDLFACAEVKQIETSSDLAFSISNAALTSFER